MKSLLWKTASELSALMQNKECSAREVAEAHLEHAKQTNQKLNALLEIKEEEALIAADAVDEKRSAGEELSPLAGVPIAIKDNLLVEGWKATAASKMLESHVASYSATVIERLRNSGAILIGRANLDEFAMGSTCETSHFGPTMNPWDTSRIPGGSSGGSAAAVAASMAPISLGSDTGGSVRQPASLCGLVGLKPTYGRVSRYGLMSLASSLDQIGTFSKTVLDTANLMKVIEGADPKDATSCVLDNTSFWNGESDIKGLRIGLPKEFFGEGMDPEVQKVIVEAAKKLESLGAILVDVSLPNAVSAIETYYIILPAEASSNFARYDGLRYGHHASGESLVESYEKSRGEGFGSEVKRRIMLGTFSLSSGAYDAFYGKALAVRDAMREDFRKAFEQVDVIFGPTSPSVAWKLGAKSDPISLYLADIYTIPANLAGNPAMSVPCGFASEMPVGFQLIGRPFEESLLYKVGQAYQNDTTWHENNAEGRF